MYDRKKLDGALNILDGNVGYMCVADNAQDLSKVLSASLEALAGVFACNLDSPERNCRLSLTFTEAVKAGAGNEPW